MITIKNSYAQEKMFTAGQLLAELFEQLKDYIKPGVSTLDIDNYVENYLNAHKMRSSTKGYRGTYHHSSCISVNDEVVHGVPRASAKLKLNDLVKVDVCASYDGYCADMARAFYLGTPSKEILAFIDCAQASLDAGIARAKNGEKLSTLSGAIQKVVEAQGYGVVRDFAGHGIGKKMHEDPEILNYYEPGPSPIIKPGMAFAIEPMITMGNYEIYVLNDGWTAKTVDKSLAMHLEDTVIVTENGPRIITRLI